MTPKHAIQAIDDVIAGDRPLDGWEELLFRRHRDGLVAKWAEECLALERTFSVKGSGKLISDTGIEILKNMRDRFARELELRELR